MTKEMSRAQEQAMFAKLNAGRTQGAINRDLSLRAAETLPNTPENVKLWQQNPRRIDIEGIDTPRTKDLPTKDEVEPNWKPIIGDGKVVSMSPLEYIERIELVNRLGSREKVKEQEAAALKKGYPGILHYPPYSPESVKSIQKGYNDRSEFYMPEIVYRADGTVGDQEGYHRAIAAINMGIKKIPVTIYGDLPATYEKNTNYKDEVGRLTSQPNKDTKVDTPAHTPDTPRKTGDEVSVQSGASGKITPKTSEFEADANLINKKIAMRAHQGTSWKPDERGKMEIEGFENEVNRIYKELSKHAKSPEQKSILKREIEEFQRDYASKENQRLSKHSSLYSTMIAGRSNFNSKQASKRSDSYDKTAREVTEWKSKAIGRISKKLQKQGIRDEGGEIQVMRNKLDTAEKKQAAMKLINKVRKSKKLSDDEKIDKIIKETGFKKATAKNAINVEFGGFEPYMLTNNNANIKRMKDRIATMEAMDAKPTTSETVNGVEIVDSSEDDRVQLFFDGKPDDTMRDKLKGSGWRWAPSVGAWQRKRTDAAIQSAKQILKGD